MANLECAKRDFESLLSNLSDSDRNQMLIWIKGKVDSDDLGTTCCKHTNADTILESIQTDLRSELPVNAVSSTETLHYPQTGPNSDCDPNQTVHVDAFLYDEDSIDDLCDDGKMSRNYCTGCGSHNVKPLTFITHSASKTQLKYMFRHLLPDLRGQTLLDVGSRTGAVLYGAYLFSGASKIIGVEMDATFCKLQSAAIAKYNMGNRVKVVHDDIQNQGSLITSSNVIVLNNVFEFFLPKDVQQRLWRFLFTILSPNTLLVTIPSLEESLEHLETGIDLGSCVEIADMEEALQQGHSHLLDDPDADNTELTNIHLYRVIKPIGLENRQ